MTPSRYQQAIFDAVAAAITKRRNNHVHPETYRVREQAGREFAQMRSRFRELEQETERKTKLSWEVSYQGANAPTKEQSSS